jgi:hypothetical protein
MWQCVRISSVTGLDGLYCAIMSGSSSSIEDRCDSSADKKEEAEEGEAEGEGEGDGGGG